MCGIAGIFSSDAPPTQEELADINDCHEHRGPDAEGYFVEPPIGLAHRRLSIVGLESGDQPIENEDGSIVVVFNGELYNHLDLREELRKAGHAFSTDADTEVLVHLYEEHGINLVDHIEGMFAIALWDRDAKQLLLARDPMGIKPLLLANDGHRIGFASELHAILRSDINQGGLDLRALSEYFAFGYIPTPRTAFKNVEKVYPGQRIVVSSNGIDRQKFYKPTINPVDHSFSKASETLRGLVTDSVQKRLMSDVPLGTFLSGGIDSTILTGVISQIRDNPVQTFTVGFAQDRFDESDVARDVARYHGTDHTEYVVSSKDVYEAIPSIIGHLGEPFADPSLLPTYIVSRETSQDLKVALSGDGADELFAGYNRYRGEYYSKYYRRLPRHIRSLLIEPTVRQFPAERSSSAGELIRKVQKFAEVEADDVSSRHFEWVRRVPDEAVSAYLNCSPSPDGLKRMKREHENISDLLPAERNQPLSKILAVDTHFGLPNQMLHKIDLASMHNSLEVRVPYLDTNVVEYAHELPLNYKINARERKRILKDAFADLIPREVLLRPKQGFDMPIGEWFKNDLKSDFEAIITRVNVPLLDSTEVLDLHARHVSGRQDYEWFLWNVYVYAHWHDQMVANGYLS